MYLLHHKVVLLGFIVSGQGVEVDESKVEYIKNWPTLVNVSQVRSFHGLAGERITGVSDPRGGGGE